MFVSLLIDDKGKICVAHNADLGGRPVSLNYENGGDHLTLGLKNGGSFRLPARLSPDISQKLKSAGSVLLMQISRLGTSSEETVPVYVGCDIAPS